MSGLRIEYQHASLEIETTRARFTINHHTPRFKMENAIPRFPLDQQNIPAPAPVPAQVPASTATVPVDMSSDWENVWAESGRRSMRMQRQYFQNSAAAEEAGVSMNYTLQNIANAANAESMNSDGTARSQSKAVAAPRPKVVRRAPTVSAPTPSAPAESKRAAKQELAQATSARSRKAVQSDQGGVKINWAQHLLEIKWDGIERPDIQWDPHTIKIQLKDHPSIEISFDPPEESTFVPRLVGAPDLTNTDTE